MTVLAACSDVPESQVRADCNGMDMVTFKRRVTDSVVQLIDPIRLDIERLRNDRAHVIGILKDGQKKAEEVAESTMVQVRDAVGILKE